MYTAACENSRFAADPPIGESVTLSLSLNQVSVVSVQVGSKKIPDVLHLKAWSLPLFYLFTFESYCVLHCFWLSILTALFLGFITQAVQVWNWGYFGQGHNHSFEARWTCDSLDLLRLCVWQVFALDKIPADAFRVGMEHLTARVPEQEGCLRPQRGCQPQKWEISLSWRDLLGEWKCFLLRLIRVGCFLEMWAASVWPTFNEKR